MKNGRKIVACITQHKACESLIKRAASLREIRDELYIVYFADEKWCEFGLKWEAAELDHLFDIAKSYEAVLKIIIDNNVMSAVIQFVEGEKVDIVVICEQPKENDKVELIHHLVNLSNQNMKFKVITEFAPSEHCIILPLCNKSN